MRTLSLSVIDDAMDFHYVCKLIIAFSAVGLSPDPPLLGLLPDYSHHFAPVIDRVTNVLSHCIPTMMSIISHFMRRNSLHISCLSSTVIFTHFLLGCFFFSIPITHMENVFISWFYVVLSLLDQAFIYEIVCNPDIQQEITTFYPFNSPQQLHHFGSGDTCCHRQLQ